MGMPMAAEAGKYDDSQGAQSEAQDAKEHSEAHQLEGGPIGDVDHLSHPLHVRFMVERHRGGMGAL